MTILLTIMQVFFLTMPAIFHFNTMQIRFQLSGLYLLLILHTEKNTSQLTVLAFKWQIQSEAHSLLLISD